MNVCRPIVEDDGVALATMDIFAGCGGLSEGLHQARAAISKWAIEYEAPAAEAYKQNHPEATMWCANCNVILTAAMLKAGLGDNCDGSPEVPSSSSPCPATPLCIPWKRYSANLFLCKDVF